MIWQRDELGGEMLDYEALAPDAVLMMDRVMTFALENRCRKITLATLLCVLMMNETRQALESEGFPQTAGHLYKSVKQCLQDANETQLRETLFHLACARTARGEVDYFQRYAWLPCAAQAVGGCESGEAVDLLQMMGNVVRAMAELPEDDPENSDRQILATMLDLERLSGMLRNLSEAAQGGAEFFGEDGSLRQGAASDDLQRCLRASLEIAQRRSADRVQTLMLFMALLEDSQGFALQGLEEAVGVGKRAEAVLDQLSGLLAPTPGVTYRFLPLEKKSFAGEVQKALQNAYVRARTEGQRSLGIKWLLLELLESGDELLQNVLSGTLKIDIPAFRQSVEKLTEGARRALPLPVEFCTCREIEPVQSDTIPREQIEKKVLRALFDRQKPAVLLYGEAGVGKSTLAERIGSMTARGEVSFLKDMRAVYIDFNSIPAELAAGRCASLLTWMLERPKCLFVVEGFAVLFRHRADELKRSLAQGKLPLIGIAAGKEREAMLGELDDADLYFAQVEVPEPDSAMTLQMMERQSAAMEQELGVAFEEGLFERARKLAEDYLISRRNPYKLVGLIREAAMEVAFNNEQGGATVTRADVAEQVSRMTGLPTETILGTGEDKDYETILGRAVKGQTLAVRKVAQRLDMIQKSLVDKKRPPATFLFVGLSGTGKTELAKSIAQVYSSSHTLITYAMENFKASHDVSGLIGTSQGYVGYEEGGKLINDLNRDPYATVLFDEVEKAHPAIWDPFLHLFDEGSITDMRGVTAYGNKAFFIMTSNIGYQKLCRMLQAGEKEEDIEAAITEDIYAAVHRPSGEKCFRPEFVGRVVRGGGIIIFSPLSLEALEGITGHVARSTMREWNQSRDIQLVIEDEVIRDIARRAWQTNERDLSSVYSPHGGGAVPYKGGRMIAKLFDEDVTGQLAATMRYMKDASQVRVSVEDGRVKLNIVGASETEIIQQTRADILCAQLEQLAGSLAVVDRGRIAAMDAGDIESLLGAVETVRGLQRKIH